MDTSGFHYAFRAQEDSTYAGYHLAYEVKKLMYAFTFILKLAFLFVNYIYQYCYRPILVKAWAHWVFLLQSVIIEFDAQPDASLIAVSPKVFIVISRSKNCSFLAEFELHQQYYT